jgi:hypothetical protein
VHQLALALDLGVSRGYGFSRGASESHLQCTAEGGQGREREMRVPSSLSLMVVSVIGLWFVNERFERLDLMVCARSVLGRGWEEMLPGADSCCSYVIEMHGSLAWLIKVAARKWKCAWEHTYRLGYIDWLGYIMMGIQPATDLVPVVRCVGRMLPTSLAGISGPISSRPSHRLKIQYVCKLILQDSRWLAN